MKKLLYLLLLIPSLAWGQDYARMNPYILGGGVTAAGFSDYCPGTGLLLCESFEKTGGDCGDSAATNCHITWTVTQAPAFNSTALDGGTNSVTLANASSVEKIEKSVTASDDMYIFALINITNFAGGTKTIFGTNRCFANVQADGKIRVEDEIAWADASTGAMSVATLYYVWLGWNRGASSDGECWACFSTTGTKPDQTSDSEHCSRHSGFTRDVQSASVYFQNGNTAGDQVAVTFDKILVDDATIGNQ